MQAWVWAFEHITAPAVAPSTWALGNFLARWREVPPKPQPTSRMRAGAAASRDPRPHASISSTKSNLAPLKSFFLYPAARSCLQPVL